GVVVERKSQVIDSIIMHDTFISPNCVIRDIICDKDVYFGEDTICGEGDSHPNQDFPNLLKKGITVIGKGARIPEKTKIGKNCLIYPDVTEGCFGKSIIDSGETVKGLYEEE
ncbi:MAG: glucose-1-phosphate adenylyltransferase, partial [candidate division WOR-3 bacterium]